MGEFGTPAGLALDPAAGRLYVSERANRRIQILELPRDPRTPTGFAPYPRVVSAWDLASAIPPSIDGVSLERLQPGALALDPSGTLHLVDEGNSVIHVFDRRLSYLRTIVPPKSDGPRRWIDLAFSPDGESLVVLDRDGARIVVLDRKGAEVASWGTRGGGEGEFLLPAGLGVAADGTVIVSDSGAHRVLRFDARGKFLSMWGAFGRDPGQFYSPRGIVIAGRDRIVVDDAGNHRGQIFDRDGKLVELFHKGGVPAQPAPPK
jgi:DNA-binding beta-propeller fold protein YncE